MNYNWVTIKLENDIIYIGENEGINISLVSSIQIWLDSISIINYDLILITEGNRCDITYNSNTTTILNQDLNYTLLDNIANEVVSLLGNQE